MAKKEKALYKIWDVTNQCYVSGNKSKTTWNSLSWVESRIADLCRSKVSYSDYDTQRKPEEFEIRKFELVCVETMSAVDMYERHKEKMLEREKAKIAQKNIRVEVERLVPDVSFHGTRSLVKAGHLNPNLLEKLKPLFKEYDKLNSLI